MGLRPAQTMPGPNVTSVNPTHHQDRVFAKRAAFFAGVKSKIGHFIARAAALQLNFNLAQTQTRSPLLCTPVLASLSPLFFTIVLLGIEHLVRNPLLVNPLTTNLVTLLLLTGPQLSAHLEVASNLPLAPLNLQETYAGRPLLLYSLCF